MEATGIHNKTIKSSLFILAIAYISLLVYFSANSIITGIFGLWAITFFCVCYTNANITHPLVWFSSAFSLYYSAHSLLYVLYNVTSVYDESGKPLCYSILALTVVVTICVLLCGDEYSNKDKYWDKSSGQLLFEEKIDKTDYHILEKSLLIGMMIAYMLTVIVSRSFVNKQQSTENRLFGISVYLIRGITFLCGVYILEENKTQKAKKLIIILCGCLCALFAFWNAERDCILRYMLVLFFTLYLKRKITMKHLFFLGPIGVILVVIINMLKYYFIDGSVRAATKGIIYAFLASDFGAPGANLQVLVNHKMFGFAGYMAIFTDIVRGFFPFIKIGRNYNSWFNDYFYSGSSYSRAFTLVGEGYLIDGAMGIFVLFSLIALIIVILSWRKYKSVWAMMNYVYGIITVISCFRGSLVDIVTGLIRTPIYAIVLFCISQYIYKKGRLRIKL